MNTSRFKNAYPNGVEIFAKGIPNYKVKSALIPDGRIGSTYYHDGYKSTAIFGGDVNMASAYMDTKYGKFLDQPK